MNNFILFTLRQLGLTEDEMGTDVCGTLAGNLEERYHVGD
jgi:hypothetical protein